MKQTTANFVFDTESRRIAFNIDDAPSHTLEQHKNVLAAARNYRSVLNNRPREERLDDHIRGDGRVIPALDRLITELMIAGLLGNAAIKSVQVKAPESGSHKPRLFS